MGVFPGGLNSPHSSLPSSPRTWGCFQSDDRWASRCSVFPTHVGVFLFSRVFQLERTSLPHARGGVSIRFAVQQGMALSSPRTWGCFLTPLPESHYDHVFPTHVGVFLIFARRSFQPWRLPHARGGVSLLNQPRPAVRASSPRTWGCFCPRVPLLCRCRVFPTHVGVFPESRATPGRQSGLPHARGGVSCQAPALDDLFPSSPRTWGCFPDMVADFEDGNVFPTHVGVFPDLERCEIFNECLPHARGGVSGCSCGAGSGAASSPRTWGCFQLDQAGRPTPCVFPTHVGVFPAPRQAPREQPCLPHARGGVSG